MGIEILVALAASALSSLGVLEALAALLRRRTPVRADLTLDAEEIEALADHMRAELTHSAGGAPPKPRTPAEVEALAIMQVYGRELLAEAHRIAKRASSERPSADHVRQAADRIGVLRDRAGVTADLALAVGSILIGAAVSYQVNLWTGGEAADGIGIWIALTLAVGVGAVVAAAAIKWRRT